MLNRLVTKQNSIITKTVLKHHSGEQPNTCTPGERDMHEEQVTSSTMGDALDRDLKRSQAS